MPHGLNKKRHAKKEIKLKKYFGSLLLLNLFREGAYTGKI